MSIAVAHTHADGAPYSAIAMCPPHLVLKWAREVLITVPHARTLVIYDLPVIATRHVRMALWKWSFDKVQPVGKGLKTSLYEMRAMAGRGGGISARAPRTSSSRANGQSQLSPEAHLQRG
jgi:hypothetical protein